jgi:hypothetical protein
VGKGLCTDGSSDCGLRYDQILFGGAADADACGSVCLECVNGQDATVDPAKGGGTATLRLTSFGFYDYDTVTKCACYFHDIPKATFTPPAGCATPLNVVTQFTYASETIASYGDDDDVGECWKYLLYVT